MGLFLATAVSLCRFLRLPSCITMRFDVFPSPRSLPKRRIEIGCRDQFQTQVAGVLVNFPRGEFLRGVRALRVPACCCSICSGQESTRCFANLKSIKRVLQDNSCYFDRAKHHPADCSSTPANQYAVAALKQRTALDHPLAHAAGLLSIFKNFIGSSYRRKHRSLVSSLRLLYETCIAMAVAI